MSAPVTSSAIERVLIESDGSELDLPAALLVGRRRLTEVVPALYPVAVEVLRWRRRLRWLRSDITVARQRSVADLPYRIKKHGSLLVRTLGDVDPQLQHNKVINLSVAAPKIDGLVIRPGEQFSFCRTVGKCTRRRGFVPGLLLDNGEATSGVGGGICQLANLLHWMVLHSPLTVTERSEHSFDPFPDHGRVLPWGVGCAVYYNYVDLRFRNDTDVTFQLRVGVGEKHLKGDLRADRELPETYRVHGDRERFTHVGTRWFRSNVICRDVIDRRSGNTVRTEELYRNTALVRYDPSLRSADHVRSAGAAAGVQFERGAAVQ